MLDELVPYEPEPCATCKLGVSYMCCFDGVHRCRVCVAAYAHAHGWNDPPASMVPAAPEPPPPPAPIKAAAVDPSNQQVLL